MKLSDIFIWIKFNTIREQNTILTLTDKDDSEKLLGVKVDVGYEWREKDNINE